jgi:hypothetical protein
VKLPEPICRSGYPISQLESFLGDQGMRRLNLWMEGQTGSICDGRRYDHENRCYVPTGCGPHGMVYYTHDVKRWAEGLPIVDW